MKIEMARLLRANRAAEELNLTVRQLRTLRAGGFVKTFDSDLGSSPLYHIEELKAFKDNLKQVSHSVDILPENTIKFISVLIRFNVSPLVLLSRILTQKMGPVIYRKGSCSLYELYFDQEHLEKVFSQSTEHGMSLKDVSKKLALNSTAIAYLIKERVIHVAEETKLSGCIQMKAVCPKSIERFDLKYVSLKKFCMEQDKRMVSVVCKIKKMKIKPIVPGKHTSKIYRRSEIEMI